MQESNFFMISAKKKLIERNSEDVEEIKPVCKR